MDLENLDNENVFDKLKEFLNGSISEHFHILEDEIDISVQTEYFNESKKVKASLNESKILQSKDFLFDKTKSNETKKVLLNQLASVNSVEAYRTIEHYAENPDKDLKNWSKLALHESRMLIESKILDENQIFISTGLGGKADKLRYFFVLFPKDDLFSTLQKEIVKKEFEFVFEKYEAIIENLNFHERYATIMTLIPIHAPIKDIIVKALSECNQFGNFLNDNFIVTNVKRLDEDEIMEIYTKQKK